MTKISCTECRERLGELLAAEVAPVHAGHNGATSSDLSLLRAHVSECEECAQSLKVLRAARETMRDFVPLVAPADLRDRIRARIESEPAPILFAHGIHESDHHKLETLDTAEEALAMMPSKDDTAGQKIAARKNEARPFVPIVPQLPTRKKKYTIRTLQREFVQFFNRPSNVAWASGMAVAFFLILIARPKPEPSTSFQAPAPEPIAPGSRIVNGSEKVLVQKPNSKTNAKVTVKVIGTPVPNAIPGVPKIAPLPGSPPTSSGYPFAFPNPNVSTDAFPEETPALPEPSPNTPAAQEQLPQALKPAAVSKTVKPPRTTLSDSSNGVASQPSSGAGPKITPDRRGYTDSKTSSPPSYRPERDSAGPPRFAKANRAADADVAENSTNGATGTSGVSGPVGMMRAPAAASSEMRAEPATPVTRFINARIVPSRDVNWGQISVVLSGGATFDGSDKARVFWRGAASAGEPIDVSFSVSGMRGQYSARLILQEVKRGDAQTVTSTSVPVNLR